MGGERGGWVDWIQKNNLIIYLIRLTPPLRATQCLNEDKQEQMMDHRSESGRAAARHCLVTDTMHRGLESSKQNKDNHLCYQIFQPTLMELRQWLNASQSNVVSDSQGERNLRSPPSKS